MSPLGSRALLAMTVLGAALLFGTSDAIASPASVDNSSRAASDSLAAPTLDIATIKGDNVALIWTPANSAGAKQFGIYADGQFLFRTFGVTDIAVVFLASQGLTGREAFTIRAEGDVAPDGTPLDQSPPSNARVAVAPTPLPAPKLTSATREGGLGGIVTLTWTRSQTDERAGITYRIFAEGGGQGIIGPNPIWSVSNQTTATFAADGCGGACPLNGSEVYTVVATDRTLAESPPSNGMVSTQR